MADWCGDTKVFQVWWGVAVYTKFTRLICKEYINTQLEAMVCFLLGFKPAWAEWYQPTNTNNQS